MDWRWWRVVETVGTLVAVNHIRKICCYVIQTTTAYAAVLIIKDSRGRTVVAALSIHYLHRNFQGA